MTRHPALSSQQTAKMHDPQSEGDEAAIDDAAKLAPRQIWEVIRRDGEEELERPITSLIWSGVAAGIMISFSVLGEAVFRTYLPDTGARYLIENLGYTLVFLFVILGRLQLFTENTITTVLPVMNRPTGRCFLRSRGCGGSS